MSKIYVVYNSDGIVVAKTSSEFEADYLAFIYDGFYKESKQ